MPLRKRASSVPDGEANDGLETTDHDEALSLDEQAEAAEADAAEAEAFAAAARARTRALRLRRQAEAAAKSTSAVGQVDLAKKPPPSVPPAEVAVVDSADVDQPARRRRATMPRISSRLVAAAFVILVSLGLLGASGYMIVHHRQVAAERQRSAEFAAAARQGVVTLMSLDFNHAEEDVKRIVDNTTGDFKKDFEGQATDFAQVARDSKVVTEATVNATAVDEMTRDTASVLVAVTTNVSNTASKEQQPRSWRLRVDVARDGGQIKLAKVEFVP